MFLWHQTASSFIPAALRSHMDVWLTFQEAQISTMFLFFLTCFLFYLQLFLPAVLRETGSGNPQRTLGLTPHTPAARTSLALEISQWQVAVAHCFTTRVVKSPADLRFPDNIRSELIYFLWHIHNSSSDECCWSSRTFHNAPYFSSSVCLCTALHVVQLDDYAMKGTVHQ